MGMRKQTQDIKEKMNHWSNLKINYQRNYDFSIIVRKLVLLGHNLKPRITLVPVKQIKDLYNYHYTM